jgi:Protein of unknown function (DUF1579)
MEITMKKRLFSIAVLAACACLARVSGADDKKPAAPSAEEKAMMEAWVKYATPGDAHKKMAALEGSWTAKVSQWMAPGAPAAESTATAEFKMILGGRYLSQSFSGTMMGQPFHGFGISGFDNAKKVTQTVWMDTFGTGMLQMTGSWDAAGALTETGSMDDFMTGKPMSFKAQMHMADNDHIHYEMWMSGPDGKMFKDLDIAYTRQK